METIRIDGIIGDWFNTAEEIKWQIEELGLKDGEDLKIIINSGGGSVFEGFAIYNYLISCPYNVYTEIEGLCGSIATLIALATDKERTSISEVGMFMIHQASVGVEGNSIDLSKQIDVLKSIDETLISVYTGRTEISREDVTTMLQAETWLTSAQAVEMGFIGKITNKISTEAVAYSFTKTNAMKKTVLERLLNKYKGETAPQNAEEPPVEEPSTEETPAEEPSTDLETRVTELEDRIAKLEELVTAMVGEVVEQFDNVVENEQVEEVVNTAVEKKLEEIKSSNHVPNASNSNVANAQTGYTPKYEKFKNRMKEIEEKTRLK